MPDRPVPQPRGEEKGYFSDLRTEHRLPFYRCSECSHLYARPRPFCVDCGGGIERQFSTGRGVIHSYTTLMRAGHPWFADGVPYTIAIVDLDEGFRSLADLVSPPYADDPHIGQRVHAEFEDVTDEIGLVHFVAEHRA